jgi:Holliday junction DNA helicase RuvA
VVEYLRGRVTAVGDGHVVVEAGGVGFRLRVHDAARFRRFTGRDTVIPAWLQFTPRRVELFGFLDEVERGRFEVLVGIPGIGPATALRLLPAWDALAGGLGAVMPEIPGVGPGKRARIGKWLARRAGVMPGKAATNLSELVRALRGLGMTAAEARERGTRAAARAPGATLEALLKLATAKVVK